MLRKILNLSEVCVCIIIYWDVNWSRLNLLFELLAYSLTRLTARIIIFHPSSCSSFGLGSAVTVGRAHGRTERHLGCPSCYPLLILACRTFSTSFPVFTADWCNRCTHSCSLACNLRYSIYHYHVSSISFHYLNPIYPSFCPKTSCRTISFSLDPTEHEHCCLVYRCPCWGCSGSCRWCSTSSCSSHRCPKSCCCSPRSCGCDPPCSLIRVRSLNLDHRRRRLDLRTILSFIWRVRLGRSCDSDLFDLVCACTFVGRSVVHPVFDFGSPLAHFAATLTFPLSSCFQLNWSH